MPAGAIPKDGPSAGVTMATAVASLVTGTPVSADVAMTGEITLTGQVLPIGGLKEKTLAAQRAGITTVIMPARNEADLEDVPEELRKGMTFVPVDRVEQVWKAAMGLKLDGRRAAAPSPGARRRGRRPRRRLGLLAHALAAGRPARMGRPPRFRLCPGPWAGAPLSVCASAAPLVSAPAPCAAAPPMGLLRIALSGNPWSMGSQEGPPAKTSNPSDIWRCLDVRATG